MTFKQLQVFLAVADTHSFSKGGTQTSLAQSTASQHIKALEEELGAKLFDRSSANITLTSVGLLFYKHADSIIRKCEESVSSVKRFQGLEETTIRIGASTIPATCIIPDLIGALSKTDPGIRIQVRQGDSQEVLQMLSDNVVELVIAGVKPAQPSLATQKLLTDRIVLVAKAGDGRPGLITPEELCNCPLLVREPGSGTRQATDIALQLAGVEPSSLRIAAQLGSSEALRRGVINSDYCAFISALAIEPELANGTLTEIELDGLSISRTFYMAWRKNSPSSPAVELFKKTLLQLEKTV